MIPISAAPKRFAASLPIGRGSGARAMLYFGLRLHSSIAGSTSGTSSPRSGLPASSGSSTITPSAHFSSMAPQTNVKAAFDESLLAANAASHTKRARLDSRVAASMQLQEKDLELAPLELVGPRTAEWWTGVHPTQCPGYLQGKLHSLPQLSLKSCSRASLQAYFDNTWTLTEVLLSSLQGEEAFIRPPYHELRHPLIFYYGHPAALYVNKLRVAGLLKAPINEYFESVFETGVDEMSWDDLSKNKMPWPSVAEVHDYRKQVYAKVSEAITNLSEEQCSSIDMKSPLWALAMAFEHERIHLETSSVLMAEMPVEFFRFPEHFPAYHASIPSDEQATQSPIRGVHYPVNEMVAVEKQQVTLGKPVDYPSYGWDNEYGQRKYDVPAFRASKFKVTNGEFLEFIRDGGYGKPELWTKEGWEWRAFRNAKWPSFWVRTGPQGLNHFDLRLIFDVVNMPWSWPVSVNLHEAAAYAKWQSLRSPSSPVTRVLTELEHNAIRDVVPVEEDLVLSYSQHKTMMHDAGVNSNLSLSSMSPVNALEPNKKGFFDVFGNAWEWTVDYFCALPGFEVHKFYEDFSTPCFDGLHHVIQGGSFISTGNESSKFSRFHFRPHFFQHASFRLSEPLQEEDMVTSDTDAPGPFVGMYPFRRSKAGYMKTATSQVDSLSLELSKHFGALNANDLSKLTQTSLEESLLNCARGIGIQLSTSRVVEVGCGPGSLSFSLSHKVRSVIGIDHSLVNIETARKLLDNQVVSQNLRSEGELLDTKHVSVDVNKNCLVEFRMADPMSLPAEMIGFDVVILNDVIDKVSSPNAVLGRLGGVRGLVRTGGLLVVTSAFQWNAETTPKSLWLGGYKTPSGQEVSSEAALCERLASEFQLLDKFTFPLLWKVTSSELRGKNLHVAIFKKKIADGH